MEHSPTVSQNLCDILAKFPMLMTCKETDTRCSVNDTPVSNEQMKPDMSLDFTNQLDFSQFNPYGSYNLYDAWFGQHLINLDASEMG
jgi:hypothetical protein